MTANPSNVTNLVPRTAQGAGALAMWSREQIDVIKELICPGASDTELELFGQVCQRTGLDPFARQIYGFMRRQREGRGDDARWVQKLSIQTSIDGFRLTAQRSGEYAGQVGPQWCGPDGRWRDVWLEKGPPAAARVGVLRTGWAQATYAVATWAEYHQRDSKGNPVGLWGTMPANQLAKCAEAAALRKVFPAELSGLYSKEEMEQADNAVDVPSTAAAPVAGPGTSAAVGEVVQPGAESWSGALRSRWGAAVAAYASMGLTPPDAPAADAPRAEIQERLRAMGAAYEARKVACEGYRALTARALAAGLDVDEIDPVTLPPGELAEVHTALADMLAAAEAVLADAGGAAAGGEGATGTGDEPDWM